MVMNDELMGQQMDGQPILPDCWSGKPRLWWSGNELVEL